VCFIYETWWISSTVDLSTVWGRTYGPGTTQYTLGGTLNGDYAIGLCYNLGTIAAGDSTIISYAYIFNGNSGIDSPGALPDPELMVNGVVVPNHDTFNTCDYPGLTRLPVGIKYGDDKDWSWSTWTWSPGTGLSATTGTTGLIININSLSGPTTYTVTGNDSGSHMNDCNHKIFIFTVLPCHSAHNNSPCINDTLKLADSGSNVGATYFWYGPGGFTSTMQNPYIYPSVFADSGLYHVIKTIGTTIDSDSTYVYIRPLPVLTLSSNSPLCQDMTDTLRLSVTPMTPGETFTWSGPAGFTSTLEFPTLTPFDSTNVGTYQVIGVTQYGCVDSATLTASLVPIPATPIITDRNYCQGQTWVPFTVVATGTVYWWPGPVGGTSTLIAPSISTIPGVPGVYHVWASQKIGSCESLRGTDSVRITTTPPAPAVTGLESYCQFIGPLDTLVVHTTLTGVQLWYTGATGGVAQPTEIWPNLNVAGSYTYYVAQVDSGCYSARTAVTTVIHPKPTPPVNSPRRYCQYRDAIPLEVVPSITGDFLTFFYSGAPGGTLGFPTPQTDTVKIDTFYANETSVPWGCISDKILVQVPVIAQPPAPRTHDTAYCQFLNNIYPLTLGVDSAANSFLNWYQDGINMPKPTPSTQNVGTTTWYVSQTVDGCESDSAAISVNIVPLPAPHIVLSRDWVCQYDSITMWYQGIILPPQPGYQWYLPGGDSAANGTNLNEPSISVKFDSASDSTYVILRASDDYGKCWGYDTARVRVIPHPTAESFTKQDVCLGDTVTLAIAAKTDNATDFIWKIDYTTLMANSGDLLIIAANSNSGGPFSITWLDTGRHIIQLNTFTTEGCTSKPTFDTVNVHGVPDASFKITMIPNTLCLEDSVYFTANTTNYEDSYTWAPEHSFTNVNKPASWGRIETSGGIITLTVTTPFGCTASQDMQLQAGTCCTVAFPNAFTPNGDGHNDYFRPLYQGFHRFHEFRIQNRWGQTVFNSANNDMKWDGNYNGVPQDLGVYYYYIKYDCGGKTIEESGDFTLVR